MNIDIPIPALSFGKRKYIIACFIDEAGTFYKAKKRYVNNMFTVTINGEKQDYIVDPNRVYVDQKTKLPTSFYNTNNPEPLLMDHKRHKKVDSISMNKIFKDKVISDLFNMDAGKQLKMMFYLILGNLALTLILLLFQFGVISTG